MKNLISKIPNLLTLIRIILTCIANIYIYTNFSKILIPFILTFIILATDFVDGKIARSYGWTSKFGAVFDVAADLFYIISSYIVLWELNVLPIWFLFVIIFKFSEFAITSFFMKKYGQKEGVFVFDLIGRYTAVLFYIVPIFSYISFQTIPFLYDLLSNTFIGIITFMAAVSSLYRISNCIGIRRDKVNKLYRDSLRNPHI